MTSTVLSASTAADEFRREFGQPIVPTLRKSIDDCDVLALDQPEFSQTLPERLKEMPGCGGGTARKIAYSVDLTSLLRLASERRGHHRHRPV
jgi:hypothetical protein